MNKMVQFLFATIEKALSILLPVWLWRKSFHFAMRRLGRQGMNYVTVHWRPKNSERVKAWSDPLGPENGLAIVMQGPLVQANDFTLESFRIYRRIFPGCQLILSTWVDQDPTHIARIQDVGVDVVLNELPDNAGFKNINLQIASSSSGTQAAKRHGARFVLKTRTDQRMYSPNLAPLLINLLEVFPVAQGFRQKKRIIAASLGSHKYMMYQISDMFLFGGVDDMATYWNAAFTNETRPDDLQDTIGEVKRFQPPEQYLCTSFLRQVGREIVWDLEYSWQSIADHFCIVDRHILDLVWFKYAKYSEYSYLRYDAIAASQELTFLEWLNLYSEDRYADRAVPYRTVQSLSFHDPVSQAAQKAHPGTSAKTEYTCAVVKL